MRRTVLGMLLVGTLAHAAAFERVYIVPEGQSVDPATVRGKPDPRGARRFGLSPARATTYEAALLLALKSKGAPKQGAEVASSWEHYVLVFAEVNGVGEHHKIRVNGTSRGTIERVYANKPAPDARALEYFNEGIDDGGCGFWQAVLDADSNRLESLVCHGVA